ncbi:Protein of unknown function DUF465 [Sphingomonadaceae bacterium]
MTHVAHELHDAFPQDGTILHDLKVGNPHFGKLADRYRLLNREIHRIESGIDAASDARAENLKKDRLSILDEVSALIASARTAGA